MLSTLLVLSVATVLAILITLSRVVSLRTIVKYGAIVDIIVSIGLMIVLAGTAVGAASAIVAGLFLAIALTVLKQWFKLYDAVMGYRPNINLNTNVWKAHKERMHIKWVKEAKQARRPRAFNIGINAYGETVYTAI